MGRDRGCTEVAIIGGLKEPSGWLYQAWREQILTSDVRVRPECFMIFLSRDHLGLWKGRNREDNGRGCIALTEVHKMIVLKEWTRDGRNNEGQQGCWLWKPLVDVNSYNWCHRSCRVSLIFSETFHLIPSLPWTLQTPEYKWPCLHPGLLPWLPDLQLESP